MGSHHLVKAFPKASEATRERSRAAYLKHWETALGKNAIRKTWEALGDCAANHRYLMGLNKRIRQEENYLSHMRPQWDE